MVWSKFILGAVLFCGMFYVHTFVKEFPQWWMGVPGLLMGLDLGKLLDKVRGK